jgi:hypothetical protein
MNDDEKNAAENIIGDTIDSAEDVRDPLEELVEKTVTDPGAPFAPEVLERLAALKKDDRAAFEALGSKLKKAGCRVMALDQAIAEEIGDTGGPGARQAAIATSAALTARRSSPSMQSSRRSSRSYSSGTPPASIRCGRPLRKSGNWGSYTGRVARRFQSARSMRSSATGFTPESSSGTGSSFKAVTRRLFPSIYGSECRV